jgi:hypothetical protein
MPETSSQANRLRSSSFIPFVLLAISLIALLSWQLWTGSQARLSGQRLREQQVRLVEESKKMQHGLELLARDLVTLSQTDEDARALVTKYHISFASPSPSPSPAASPLSVTP